MTIVLSTEEYQHLWRSGNSQISYPDPNDSGEQINVCPTQLGQGYERWVQLGGISLLIVDVVYQDDIWLEDPEDEDLYLAESELGFNLMGYCGGLEAGKNFIYGSGVYESSSNWKTLGQQRILKVDVHLESPETLQRFVIERREPLSPELKRLVEPLENSAYQTRIITPQMRYALQQVLDCPFQGLTKTIYLESKCLELIALSIDQLASEQTHQIEITLRSDQCDRIHHARETLLKNLDNPPSLLALARQVGLNDCTLKQGFRQLFNTTVFGYLQQQRMEWAKTLLLEQQLKISTVAHRVGYKNPSQFAAAFKRQTGMTPKEFSRARNLT